MSGCQKKIRNENSLNNNLLFRLFRCVYLLSHAEPSLPLPFSVRLTCLGAMSSHRSAVSFSSMYSRWCLVLFCSTKYGLNVMILVGCRWDSDTDIRILPKHRRAAAAASDGCVVDGRGQSNAGRYRVVVDDVKRVE